MSSGAKLLKYLYEHLLRVHTSRPIAGGLASDAQVDAHSEAVAGIKRYLLAHVSVSRYVWLPQLSPAGFGAARKDLFHPGWRTNDGVRGTGLIRWGVQAIRDGDVVPRNDTTFPALPTSHILNVACRPNGLARLMVRVCMSLPREMTDRCPDDKVVRSALTKISEGPGAWPVSHLQPGPISWLLDADLVVYEHVDSERVQFTLPTEGMLAKVFLRIGAIKKKAAHDALLRDVAAHGPIAPYLVEVSDRVAATEVGGSVPALNGEASKFLGKAVDNWRASLQSDESAGCVLDHCVC